MSRILSERVTRVYFSFLVLLLLVAVFAPLIAPYGIQTQHYDESGNLLTNQPPSPNHILGTNDIGQDVFSRIVIGTRPTLLTGIVGGLFIITLGLLVGLTAGYFGGSVETVLMRITDAAYALPLLPFALVVVPFIGETFWASVFIIGLLLWRGSARVIRSQVLQVRERPYVLVTKTNGASSWYVIRKHIMPSVASIAVLFMAIGIGYTILIQAGLAFLGITNPFVPSWGVLLRNAYRSGYLTYAWWWSIPPGLLISLTVLSTFMLGRGFETATGQSDELVEMG